MEELKFNIKSIKKDRGGELIGKEFKEEMSEKKIKLRKNRNSEKKIKGKVES